MWHLTKICVTMNHARCRFFTTGSRYCFMFHKQTCRGQHSWVCGVFGSLVYCVLFGMCFPLASCCELNVWKSILISVFQDPNPFLSPSVEPDALLRSTVPPLPCKEQERLGGSGRVLAPLHFPSELLPFDEALRDVCTIPMLIEGDVVARHGGQLLDIKAAERKGQSHLHSYQ